MRFIDLSQPLYAGCPNCPVHPAVAVELMDTHATSGWHTERITLASHTGSHLDAPLHKLPGGKAISDFPLEAFAGPCVIVDLRDSQPNRRIDAATLAARLPARLDGVIVLLATGWGDRRRADDAWHHQSPFLAPDGATLLVERGIKGVGIDHYSIGGSRDPDNSQTHINLLSHDVWIVEELKFNADAFSAAPTATFMCLPLNTPGFSGIFCRPVLLVQP